MFSTRLKVAVLPLCIVLGSSLPNASRAQESPDIAQALAKADAPLPDGYSAAGCGCGCGCGAGCGCAAGCGCQPGYMSGPGAGCDTCGDYSSCGSCGCGPGCAEGYGPMAGCACDGCYDCGPLCSNYPSDYDRWYVSISGATEHREEVHEVDDRWTFIKFDEGFQANAAIGYALDSCRLELESSFMNNDIQRAGAFGYSSSSPGNANIRALMLNGYYDFCFRNCCWEPYVGAGVGVYQTELNGFYPRYFEWIGEPFEGHPVNATSDVAFAYQLRAGVSRPIGRRTEFFTGYRYFNGNDQKFSAGPFAWVSPTLQLNGAELHALEIGLRVKF